MPRDCYASYADDYEFEHKPVPLILFEAVNDRVQHSGDKADREYVKERPHPGLIVVSCSSFTPRITTILEETKKLTAERNALRRSVLSCGRGTPPSSQAVGVLAT